MVEGSEEGSGGDELMGDGEVGSLGVQGVGY